MCGIAGIFDFHRKVKPEAIARATATLRMRGPDDRGVWTEDDVGLGHQRLAVLDLSNAGHQPMHSAHGRYVIVFNGEIYNFLEVREVLERTAKRKWRSNSDTEVLLAAFEQWGPACVARFRGMFALAIWDRVERVMFAARDRLGVKPLYYHYSSDCFAFGSRPRALLSLNSGWSNPLDEQALRFFVESGYIPAPYSAFEQIRKLPPAHWMLADESGLRIQRYWESRNIPPEPSWRNRKEDDLLDELDEILNRSVASRMISDAPLGAFLSGGIDSSLVVAMMAKRSPDRVKTFTIGFEDKAYDESPHAAAVARHLSTEHFCEHLNVQDLLNLWPTYRREFDEPFFDSSAFPTMAVSRLARQQVTVSLSGDGGDELFGGYHSYRLAHAISPFYRLPAPVRGVVAAGVGVSSRHEMKLLSGALSQRDSTEAFSFARSIAKDYGAVLPSEILRRTIGLNELFAEEARHFPAELEAPEVAMRLDTSYTLPDDYLQKVDVSSMAFSLESREPLLDHNLVEWAMKLPLKWKLRGNQNKYLLRKLAYRYVPQKLLDRPKKGFEVPIADWLRGPLREWAQRKLTDSQNFVATPLDQESLLDLMQIHLSGARQVHPLLWAALVYLDFVQDLPAPAELLAPN